MLERVDSAFGSRLPRCYIEFLSECNGLQGFIGDGGYLMLWPTEELPRVNEDHNMREFASGLVLIGCDMADSAYCVDTPRVACALSSMCRL